MKTTALITSIAACIVALASATAATAEAATSPYGWMTARDANAALYDAPVYLPGKGQFAAGSARCIAYGAVKRDAQRRVLRNRFRCIGRFEHLSDPGVYWSLIFHAAPSRSGLSLKVLGVEQANCQCFGTGGEDEREQERCDAYHPLWPNCLVP